MPTPNLTKPVEKVANVTRTDIERHETLGQQARDYENLARAKRKEQTDLKAKILAFVESKAVGKSRTINRSGYRLSIVTVKKGVQWAKEFAQAMGDAAAAKLRKNVGTADKLQVEKI